METEHHIQLTSAEISGLWMNYMGDTMAICMYKYFLNKNEDAEIRPVLEKAVQLSEQHVKSLTTFFSEAGYPVPQGFTEQDVNKDVPRLFSDPFMLTYTKHMAKGGLATYASVLPDTKREDVRHYFSECIKETTDLFNQATGVLQSKGLDVRPPYLAKSQRVDFVHDQHFLAGWFGEQRPLTATEITYFFSNIQTNELGQALCIGFSQVAHSQKARQFFLRGRDIAGKHVEIFSSYLNKDLLPSPMSWSTEVNDSTVAPFSDKLMMYHIGLISASGMGNYGISMSLSQRRDIAANYARLMAEVGKFAEDGAQISIKNAWLERPPLATDRDELAKK